MAEASESGLKGFLGRLFGREQPHPRRSPAPIPVQPNPEELQARAERAKKIYENEKLRLGREFTLAIPDIREIIDYQKEATDLVKGVKAITIHGKFYAGTKVRDRIIVPTDSSDFDDYGDVQKLPYKIIGGEKLAPIHILGGVIRHLPKARDGQTFIDLRKKHFLAYLNTEEGGNTVVTYIFLHDHKDSSFRPSGNAIINFLLGQDAAARLLGLIRKNPDFAETFLQKAAGGFEADVERQKPGIRRIKSDEIVLLHPGNFDPDNFNIFRNPYDGSFQRLGLGNFIPGVEDGIKKEMVSNQNNQIERLGYSRPFGAVDPSLIP